MAAGAGELTERFVASGGGDPPQRNTGADGLSDLSFGS